MKVLILDAHSNAALCVLQSLGRAGHRTYLAGSDPGSVAWSSRYVRTLLIYPDPFAESDAFKRWVVDLQAAEGFDFVLPVTDQTIYPLMELRRESDLGQTLVLPTDESFPWVFDKARTAELARSCDVPLPPSVEVAAEDGDLDRFDSFPLFVKPVRSKVWREGEGRSLSPRLVRDAAELRRTVGRLLRYGPVSVQEHVRGAGVGIGVLCDRGEILSSFAYRRIHEYPLTGGASTYRVSIERPRHMMQAAEHMLGKIAWSGPAMVEFKEDEGRYWLMEINGRFWGSLPLPYLCGVDFPRDLIDWLANRRRPVPGDYRVGLFVRNVSGDIAWFKQNLRADRRDPCLLTRPVGATVREGLRILAGRERWDHASARDPIPILTILGRTATRELRLVASRLRTRRILRAAPSRTRRVLRKRNVRRILILCHGNICRSPLAERYLRGLLGEHEYEIVSAGFHGRPGRGSPDRFLELAGSAGVALHDHRSRVVDRELVRWADAVVIMDRQNWQSMCEFDRHTMSKVVWLGCLRGNGQLEIQDPYNGSDAVMVETIAEVKRCTEALASRLRANLHSSPGTAAEGRETC